MSTITVQIIRRQDRAFVDAVLHTELVPTVLIEAEKEWGPIRLDACPEALSRRQGRGDSAALSLGIGGRRAVICRFLAYRCFGIKCDGKWQGLLMVKLAGMEARLEPDKGRPLVYIDYLESAPWNLRAMVDTPLYGGVGPVLMRTAVQLSHDEGFYGRIGLHALHQAEDFYRDDCGCTVADLMRPMKTCRTTR
jgi:hypothetical protein